MISSLIPVGFAVQSVNRTEGTIVVVARAEALTAARPLCGFLSRRIHSRYIRQVSDLPCSGREVHLHVMARRFVCETAHCRRRIFAERFGDGVIAERSRRTTKRLMLPVSNDTLLQVVRRRTQLRSDPLTVAGIDDWAFRRNHRYGIPALAASQSRRLQCQPRWPEASAQSACHLSQNPDDGLSI